MDGAAAVTWRGETSPFGTYVYTSGTGSDPDLRLPGQWLEAGSGLYHNWHRDYDPSLGRYIEADPLGIAAGQSVYGYVGQDPLNAVDPEGLIGAVRGGLIVYTAVKVAEAIDGALCREANRMNNNPGSGPVRLGAIFGPGAIAGIDSYMGGPLGIGVPWRPRLGGGGKGSGFGGGKGSGGANGNGAGGGDGGQGAGRGNTTPASAPVGRRAPNSERANRQLQTPPGRPRHAPETVNGVPYSGHALDQMQNRGLVPSAIETAMNPRNLVGRMDGVSTYFDATNNVQVIVSASGRIITVY